MIVGIGSDLCDAARIAEALESQGHRFRNRIFSEREQAAGAELGHPALFYAVRFAAKEACAKALGTGITDRVRWKHIEVLINTSGQPTLNLTEGALRRAKRLAGGRGVRAHLSIGHDGEFVNALVVLEAG